MSEDLQSSHIQDQDSAFAEQFKRIIIENKQKIAAYDARYAKATTTQALDWHKPGIVEALKRIEHGLLLTCTNGTLELIWFAEDCLRVRLLTDAAADYHSYYTVAGLKPHPLSFTLPNKLPDVEQDITELYIDTDRFTYIITTEDFGITIESRDGQPIFNEFDGVVWRDDGAVGTHIQLMPGEASYGTGERAFDLNLRGRQLALWNTDPAGYQRGDDPVNTCVSFYLGVHDYGAYGLLWDNPARGHLDIGYTKADELRIESEVGPACYYVFPGKTVNDVLAAYTNITGRMPLPPLWALGYHQSRYSYKTANEMLTVARTLRERNLPCDAIYLDIHYMDQYKIFTHDQEAFPDLAGMIAELHALNIKVVSILDPGVKVEAGYGGYDAGIAQDIFLKYPDGEPAAGVVWPGLCHFPDFSNPRGRDYWREQLSALLDAGIDGIWNDMNEPLIFNNDAPPSELPDYVQHTTANGTATHLQMHNLYGVQMGQASKAALASKRPGKRQFSIVRAGAAGTQRDSLVWTGDNYSTWDDLRLSIGMLLQLGLSGISFAGADVGGFNEDCPPELMVRWMQAGALLPFFRNHSAINSAYQEPWRYAPKYEGLLRDAIELRYRLMPYLYSCFAECAFEGKPIVRPLFTAEPGNPHLRSIDDCFLVGDDLLVAPILHEAALRRTVYLPEGDWYNFHTNERYSGGQLINVEAPLDTLPIFIHTGTTFPMWPVMQHLDPQAVTELTLRAYVDMGETHLYEDAGEGLGYLNGEFRWLTFQCDETADTFTIKRHVDGDFRPSYRQIRLEIGGASKNAAEILIDGERLQTWDYTDGLITCIVDADFATVKMTV